MRISDWSSDVCSSDLAAMGHAMPQAAEPVPDQQPMSGMDHAAMGHGTMPPADESPAQQPMSGTDHVAMGHAMPQAWADDDTFYEPGSGQKPRDANGGKIRPQDELKAQDRKRGE